MVSIDAWTHEAELPAASPCRLPHKSTVGPIARQVCRLVLRAPYLPRMKPAGRFHLTSDGGAGAAAASSSFIALTPRLLPDEGASWSVDSSDIMRSPQHKAGRELSCLLQALILLIGQQSTECITTISPKSSPRRALFYGGCELRVCG